MNNQDIFKKTGDFIRNSVIISSDAVSITTTSRFKPKGSTLTYTALHRSIFDNIPVRTKVLNGFFERYFTQITNPN
jgi:hypothetical protein